MRGPTTVESIPAMNGNKAAPKLPNAALRVADVTSVWSFHHEMGNRILHNGEGHEMDFWREQISGGRQV